MIYYIHIITKRGALVDGLRKYAKIIRKNPLFSGMTDDELYSSVGLLSASIGKYKKGEVLHQPWTPMTKFGLVLSGVVQACCDDLDGNRMIMTEVQPGTSFGESLCYLKTPDSPVYIYASEDAEVLWLSLERLYSGSTDKAVLDLQKRFTALLASRTLSMNSRIQILSRLTIRGKLMVYFSELAALSGSDTFDIPFSREDMATYIGADRAALSRELSRLKREGVIDYDKNRFTIKKHIEK